MTLESQQLHRRTSIQKIAIRALMSSFGVRVSSWKIGRPMAVPGIRALAAGGWCWKSDTPQIWKVSFLAVVKLIITKTYSVESAYRDQQIPQSSSKSDLRIHDWTEDQTMGKTRFQKIHFNKAFSNLLNNVFSILTFRCRCSVSFVRSVVLHTFSDDSKPMIHRRQCSRRAHFSMAFLC